MRVAEEMAGRKTITIVALAAIALAALAAVLYAGGLVAVGPATSTATASPKLTVVVSFNPIYYLVKPVVGNSVNIQQIIAPGMEPHDYEPTPQDVYNMSQGKVFFYDGPSLENWAVSLAQSTNEDILLVPLIDSVNTSQIGNDTSITVSDPHFWLDPALMPSVVEQIRNTMIRIDPSHAANYTANANAFIVQLDALNVAYKSGLAHCGSRTVVDSHAFLGYLAISYNLTELPVGSENPDAEVSAQHVSQVITNATADHVHAIFQESADPTVAVDQNIAQAINGTIYGIYTMEILTPRQVAGGANYTSLMYDNLRTLERGLKCTSS
jgi:zinc transport system substrate-binding protein